MVFLADRKLVPVERMFDSPMCSSGYGSLNTFDLPSTAPIQAMRLEFVLRYLECPDSSAAMTHLGRIAIDSTPPLMHGRRDDGYDDGAKFEGIWIDDLDWWVMLGKERLVSIAPEYRRHTFAMGDSVILLSKPSNVYDD